MLHYNSGVPERQDAVTFSSFPKHPSQSSLFWIVFLWQEDIILGLKVTDYP